MHVPVFSSDHVFQKLWLGLRIAPSGGSSVASLAETVQPGAPRTGAEVFVAPLRTVAVISMEGAGVNVGALAILVSEFCACTVCATAVEICACVCEAAPLALIVKARMLRVSPIFYL